MDPFHERLARVALDTAARYGFCLAGGYAVQAHGFVERVSKDVDLFTTMAAAGDFPTAQAAVLAGLRADGLEVAVEREGPTFARLAVADPVGDPARWSWAWTGGRTRRSSWRSGRYCIRSTPPPTGVWSLIWTPRRW